MDQHLFENLIVFLKKSGWAEHKTQYESLTIYTNEHYPNIDLIIPKIIDLPDSIDRLNDAIQTLSILLNRSPERVINTLNKFSSDIHNYRVPIENIASVPLDLAEEIISSTRKLIYFSSQIIYDQMVDYFKKEKQSKTEVANNYIQQCSFGHTFRGSFGFRIEAPLNLKSLGLFGENIPTFERKVSQRIFDGMSILKKAEEYNSDSYIIDNVVTGFNAKMLKEVLEIGTHLNYRSLEYSADWAPVLPKPIISNEPKEIELNRHTFNLIEKAVSKIKDDEEEYNIFFTGFPEGLHSKLDNLFEDVGEGKRSVSVRGFSNITKEITLRFDLGLVDYMKAVDAHKNKNEIKIKCLIRKKPRGWEVISHSSLELI